MRRKLMERKRHASRRDAPPAEAVRDCGHGPRSRRRQGSRQGWAHERAGGGGQATSRGPGADRAAAGAGAIAEASALHFFRDDVLLARFDAVDPTAAGVLRWRASAYGVRPPRSCLARERSWRQAASVFPKSSIGGFPCTRDRTGRGSVTL